MENFSYIRFHKYAARQHRLKLDRVLAMIIISIACFSCGKSSVKPVSTDTTKTTGTTGTTTTTTTTGTISGGTGTYIGGFESATNLFGQTFTVAKIWKDGKAFALTDGSHDAAVTSIFVTATDVYAAGYEYLADDQTPIAKIWKDGKATTLATTASEASSVFVSGGDVYVAGYMQTGNTQAAVIWKNGVAGELGAASNPDQANSVYVVGATVYATGLDNYRGKVWVQSAGTYLSDNNALQANFITVSGGDVYIAGKINNTGASTGYGGAAAIWKNGTITKLTTNTSDAWANAVYINGKDIYAVGQEKGDESADGNFVAKIWKNGVATKLSHYESSGNSVLLSGTDVYVLGDDSKDYNPGAKGIVTLWKNGVPTTYTDGTNNAHGASLFIK